MAHKGTLTPTNLPTPRAQAPAQFTTLVVLMSPSAVRTPVTRRIPRASVAANGRERD